MRTIRGALVFEDENLLPGQLHGLKVLLVGLSCIGVYVAIAAALILSWLGARSLG